MDRRRRYWSMGDLMKMPARVLAELFETLLVIDPTCEFFLDILRVADR